LEITNFGLTDADLNVVFQAGEEIGIGAAKLSDIIAHLPPASAQTTRSFSPPIALTIRAWGKSGDTLPTEISGWEPIRNAHPRW
jgi:hypothetical protein